jgi:hypothetical protein
MMSNKVPFIVPTLAQRIAERDATPTAQNEKKNNNQAAFAESVFIPENTVNGSRHDDASNKRHGFSKSVAELKNQKGEKLRDNAAIILRYLCNTARKYGHVIERKKWARVNLNHISKQYPYMGRSTVDENVLRLQSFGCCEIENLNSEFHDPKYDRTRCYHIPKKWMNAAEEELRCFDAALAARIGVPAAVIYFNFNHWIGECERLKREKRVRLSPANLKDLLPYDKSTIKRAINQIAKAGLIPKVPGMEYWYAQGIKKQRGQKRTRRGQNRTTT